MRRTLIVEDEAPIRNLVAAVLRRENIPSHTAANGREALDLMARNSYGCVLLDLMMPIMNGHTVIEQMRLWPEPRPPVIVMTAASDAQIGDLDPAVVKLIIRKPFDVGRVLEAVRAYCAEGESEATIVDEGDDQVTRPVM